MAPEKKTDHDTSRLVQRHYRNFLRMIRKYLDEKDQALVRRAVRHTLTLEGSEVSFTGDPYLIHAMNVARIVVEQLGLGADAVIGALYHDIRRISKISLGFFEQEFGAGVRDLVEGLGKISGLDPGQAAVRTENFREMILNLAGDIRVILIRLAEQLEVMRNLDKAAPADQVAIATESYYLYAPLAHRLGLYNLKSELEDLSMKYLEPEVYEEIQKKIARTRAQRNRLVREFIEPVKKRMDAEGVRYTVKSRMKSIHSIWTKMKKQNVSFEEVYDIFAVRIILESEGQKEKEDCWRVYSIVTDLVPEAADVAYRLGRLYDRAGKKDEAFKAYQKAQPYLSRMGVSR